MAQIGREILLNAIRALLRPVISFCVLRSVKFQELLDLIKSLYLEVAAEQLRSVGADPNVSKLSAVTGLQRRDVSRLQEGRSPARTDGNLIGRIIGQWQHDGRFNTATGRPRTLTLERGEGDFRDLVETVSSDLNPYTILFELERSGSVERTRQSGIRLRANAFQPKEIKDSLELLGADANDLIHGVYENIFERRKYANLHIKTYYDNIPAEHETRVRKWFLDRGAEFHRDGQNFLSELDRDVNPTQTKKKGTIRAALGSFSRVVRLDEDGEDT